LKAFFELGFKISEGSVLIRFGRCFSRCFFLSWGFIELSKVAKVPNSVSNVLSHHSGAQGRDFAGRKRSGGSGAVATGGG
jgi:hypothetical protein